MTYLSLLPKIFANIDTSSLEVAIEAWKNNVN